MKSKNAISGVIEHRDHTVGVQIPDAVLLTFDAMAYAITQAEANRTESRVSQYTRHEQQTFLKRAAYLDDWVKLGCEGCVSFATDVNLYVRSAFGHAVVTAKTLDTYLDAVLAVSSIVPRELLESPAFAIRANGARPELWVTNTPCLRNARRYPGPDIRVIEKNVVDIKAIIANQNENFISAALLA